MKIPQSKSNIFPHGIICIITITIIIAQCIGLSFSNYFLPRRVNMIYKGNGYRPPYNNPTPRPHNNILNEQYYYDPYKSYFRYNIYPYFYYYYGPPNNNNVDRNLVEVDSNIYYYKFAPNTTYTVPFQQEEQVPPSNSWPNYYYGQPNQPQVQHRQQVTESPTQLSNPPFTPNTTPQPRRSPTYYYNYDNSRTTTTTSRPTTTTAIVRGYIIRRDTTSAKPSTPVKTKPTTTTTTTTTTSTTTSTTTPTTTTTTSRYNYFETDDEINAVKPVEEEVVNNKPKETEIDDDDDDTDEDDDDDDWFD